MKSNPYEHMYLRDQEVADAIRTVLRSMPSLHVGGRSFTPEQLATLIERRVAAANEHDAAEAAWAEKAEAYCDLDDVVGPAMCDLRKLAPMLFGPEEPRAGRARAEGDRRGRAGLRQRRRV